jgi:hypothetical protein
VKNGNGTEKALREEISGLQEKLVELTSRLQMLEGRDGNGNAVVQVNSRRDLLKLAGAVAAGAAGAVVLRPIGAAATVGNPVVLGHDASAGNNDSNATTHLGPTTASQPSPLVQVEGQGLPTGTNFPPNPNAHSHQGTPAVDQPISLPLLLVVAPYGVFPTTGTPAAPVYPGHAPVQGIGGPVNDGTDHVSEGVDGWASVNLADVDGSGNLLAFGAGVVGQSDNGIGVVGAAATDVAAFGAGYIAQTSITDNSGAKTAGPPPLPVYNFEMARDKDGALWLSTALVTNDPNFAWRRMNTIIPINPFRLYDSRPNARPANSTTTIQVGGANGFPSDTIGVFGNLTALNPSADGFLTMWPTGQPLASTNSLNYSRGVTAISNHVTVALGTGGAVNVYVSGNGSTNFLFDVQGYLR